MSEHAAFRVVGVRSNGDRLVVSDCIERQQAEQLRDRLLASTTFREIVIEPDRTQAGKETHDDDPLETISL
ncbi:MAG: hypothetical protein ACT4QC_17270 [Planctomycetaceae bacterium]